MALRDGAGVALARLPIAIPLIAFAALLVSAIAVKQPNLAVALVGGACATALVVRAPAISLTLVLFLTCVVPYGVQNIGGGNGASTPGLFASDVLLLLSLGWAVVALAKTPISHRQFRVALALVAFLALVALQFVHGVRAGNDLSRAGQEARTLLGFGTFLIALPLLSDRRSRRQLLIGFAVIGLLLGLWGVLQWFAHLSFGLAGDVGVRSGVRLTTDGSGQLQGGEYGFPVAVIMSFAVLASGGNHSRRLRAVLVLILALNTVSLFLTFERSFWLDALLGIAFVVMRLSGSQRAKVLIAAPFVVIVALVVTSSFASSALTTAVQRALSLGQYGNDASVRYRVVESQYVLQRIRAHPLTGSGLAATIFWGQPWAQVPPKTYPFSHDGYLWLAWKLGIPAAILLVALLAWAIIQRGPPRQDPLDAALRRGAQGALAGLLLASVTFPTFNAFSLTAAIGVLLALATSGRSLARRGAPQGSYALSRTHGDVPWPESGSRLPS